MLNCFGSNSFAQFHKVEMQELFDDEDMCAA